MNILNRLQSTGIHLWSRLRASIYVCKFHLVYDLCNWWHTSYCIFFYVSACVCISVLVDPSSHSLRIMLQKKKKTCVWMKYAQALLYICHTCIGVDGSLSRHACLTERVGQSYGPGYREGVSCDGLGRGRDLQTWTSGRSSPQTCVVGMGFRVCWHAGHTLLRW